METNNKKNRVTLNDIPIIFDFEPRYPAEGRSATGNAASNDRASATRTQQQNKLKRVFDRKPSKNASNFLGNYLSKDGLVCMSLRMEGEDLIGDFRSADMSKHSEFKYLSYVVSGRELTGNTWERTFVFYINEDDSVSVNCNGDIPDIELTYVQVI